MISSSASMLSCSVEVRTYKLIPQPSRWGLQGERSALVQSPVLEISDIILRVPVKRHSHVEELNSVTFLPKGDIAEDINRKRTVLVNAHGVALSASEPSDDLDYERGDTLWICIGSKTQDYDHSVPVINLQTFKQGIIGIDKVCWYPKIQGPDSELWTLGGETRKLKHCGSRKFSHWSWVICQRLDGGKPTTKSVEIPVGDIELPNRRLLSAGESKLFYEKRFRAREGAGRNEFIALPSPLITPPQLFESPAKKARYSVESSQSTPPKPTDLDVWRRIMAMAKQSKATYNPLQLSTIHTGKQFLTQRDDQETTFGTTNDSEAEESISRLSSSSSTYSSLSNSSTCNPTSLDNEQPQIAIFKERSSESCIASLRLQGTANRKARQSGDGITMYEGYNDIQYDILSNPDLLCDLKDPNCKRKHNIKMPPLSLTTLQMRPRHQPLKGRFPTNTRILHLPPPSASRQSRPLYPRRHPV